MTKSAAECRAMATRLKNLTEGMRHSRTRAQLNESVRLLRIMAGAMNRVRKKAHRNER